MLQTLLLLTVLMAPQERPRVPDCGQLQAIDASGKATVMCPLKSTKVTAQIAGLGARVNVVQEFNNPTSEPIEAVYTFPLPSDAAVDQMKMHVGDRIIVGQIKPREEARAVYERAKAAGQVASLLDQERPNIFTQSVANIMPGAKVEIEISYVQAIKYEDGQLEFSFPMVVGPRFNPPSTPDPGRVSPPVVVPGTRTGTNVELSVNIDAGAGIEQVQSVLHAITVKKEGTGKALVTLSRKDEIPNRDFILRYKLKGDGVRDSLMTYIDPQKGGHFCLTFFPPKTDKAEYIRPKEMIFVIDQSGSQTGFPLEKSKELTKKLIHTLNADDTFNVITFSNEVHTLWPKPMPYRSDRVDEAINYVDRLQANGGTYLLNAVQAAMGTKPEGDRVRLVLFNTDGFVGNDFEILNAVKQYRENGRMFTFGIGNGVNRFLIDSMSAEGRGDSEIVTLAEAADAAVARFVQRTRSPILTDIKVSFEGLDVGDVTPTYIPDVFSQRPVVVYGRYLHSGTGKLHISGMLGGRPWKQTLSVTLPDTGDSDSSIASLWARQQVEDLMREDWQASAHTEKASDVVPRIVRLAMDYGLMTQYTSFVAVEQRVVNVGGKQRTVNVPVELTEGVDYEGVFGKVPAGGSAGFAYSRSSSGKSGVMRGAAYGGGSVSSNATLGLGRGGNSDSAVEERVSSPYEAKVAKSLRDAKPGKVEIQVLLTELNDDVIAKLKELGLTIEDKDKVLKVVFATCDQAVLIKLAELKFVAAVQPL